VLEKPKNSRTGISFSLSSAAHTRAASAMQHYLFNSLEAAPPF